MTAQLSLPQLARSLRAEWIDTYVATFEEGRVQKHPHARFVNARGECCVVGALVGARSGGDVVGSEVWSRFRGSALEELSRRFESRRLTGQLLYEECLLVQAERGAQVPVALHV